MEGTTIKSGEKNINILRDRKFFSKLSANSLVMITNYKLELIVSKKLTSKVMQKRWNIYRYQKNSCKLSANPLALTIKQQIIITYIEEIIIKCAGKKMKYY